MRSFLRLGTGLDTNPVLQALFRQPDLWNRQTFRTQFPNTPHADVDDIWLRFSDPAKCTETSNVIGDDRPIWHDAAPHLSEVKPLVLNLMRFANAYQLDRLLITRLRPGARILPHADADGDYVQESDRLRYHVVLQGLPGSLYTCGDETVQMLTGETWLFNAREVHSIHNNSAADRIHLLVDVRVWL